MRSGWKRVAQRTREYPTPGSRLQDTGRCCARGSSPTGHVDRIAGKRDWPEAAIIVLGNVAAEVGVTPAHCKPRLHPPLAKPPARGDGRAGNSRVQNAAEYHHRFLRGNRVVIALEWCWAYLTYRPSTRLIFGESVGQGAKRRRTTPIRRIRIAGGTRSRCLPPRSGNRRAEITLASR